MHETCNTCTILLDEPLSNRNPYCQNIGIFSSDHNLTEGQHSNWVDTGGGKSCKLGTHVPGDCGTIWCYIHSNKAEDGIDTYFKGKYMHMLYSSDRPAARDVRTVGRQQTPRSSAKRYTRQFATFRFERDFEPVCYINMVGDCFDMLISGQAPHSSTNRKLIFLKI